MINAERGPYGLYTHGIYVVSACALGLAVLYVIVTRDGIGAFIVAVTTASHYALDYLTGTKPTWPGGPIIGLGIYDHPWLDVLLEGATILIGWLLYRRTLPREQRNSGTIYAVLCTLLAFQIAAGVAFFLKAGGQLKCY
jgi:hypothetical protein